jgi:uncharacterized Zn finger protein (UPF0148 family)
MSSDDSEFDKEAEREKLREKYGDEDEDRENTRRMSELLLQGATMTGKHCDNCSDPIFRHDGQEFCPSCQYEAQAKAQGQNTGGNDQSRDTGTATQSEVAANQSPGATQTPNADQSPEVVQSPDADQSPEATQSPETDDEPRVEINDVRVADQHADQSNLRRPPSQANSERRQTDDSDHQIRGPAKSDSERGPDARERTAHDRAQAHDHTQAQNRTQARDRVRAHDHQHSNQHAANQHAADQHAADQHATDAGDLGIAREALVRKLTDLARRAETTDDVTRSRELLSATREAAEALAALDRANR